MQSSSQIITTNKPTPSLFLQAGCPSCRPTNSVKALKGKQQQLRLLKVSNAKSPAAVAVAAVVAVVAEMLVDQRQLSQRVE